MQSKVTSYMKLDSQSDSECSVGNPSKAKYHILPTNDDDASLVASHFTSTSVTTAHGLGEIFMKFLNSI